MGLAKRPEAGGARKERTAAGEGYQNLNDDDARKLRRAQRSGTTLVTDSGLYEHGQRLYPAKCPVTCAPSFYFKVTKMVLCQPTLLSTTD